MFVLERCTYTCEMKGEKKKQGIEDRNFHVGELKFEGARDTKISEKSL